MFSRLFTARLKSAELTLRKGHLDEAHRLATLPDLKDDPKAARIRAELVEPLIERARSHFAADRFTEALIDLDKASDGDTQQDRIQELRQQIEAVASARQEHEASRRDRLDRAQARIARGSLRAGRELIKEVGAVDSRAKELCEKADARIDEARELLARAQQACEQQDLETAVGSLRRARQVHPQAESIGPLEQRICEMVLTKARQTLEAGRPQRAADELAILRDLGGSNPERRDLDEALACVRTAGEAVRRMDIDAARKAVTRLRSLLPNVSWVDNAVDDLRIIDEKLLNLSAGPLAERIANGGAVKHHNASGPTPYDETVILRDKAPSLGSLPKRLLMLVDGGGSFMIHMADRISLGRANSDKPADVPILTDISEHHADIMRVEDEYFLYAPRESRVNNQVVAQSLLNDGDKVQLGRKTRFTFRRPSRRSGSAILVMGDQSRLPHDVRRVLLFTGLAIIGHGPTAHLPCRTATQSLILFVRDGQLWIRPESTGGSFDAKPVVFDEPMEFHGVSFVVKNAESMKL